MEFVLEVVSPNTCTARAVPLRVTCLYHELFDGPMNYVAVVVAVARMDGKVFDRFRTPENG